MKSNDKYALLFSGTNWRSCTYELPIIIEYFLNSSWLCFYFTKTVAVMETGHGRCSCEHKQRKYQEMIDQKVLQYRKDTLFASSWVQIEADNDRADAVYWVLLSVQIEQKNHIVHTCNCVR